MEAAKLVLKGKTREVITTLKEKMSNASKLQEFELALKYRNQILALEHLQDKQSVEKIKKYDQDVLHFMVREHKAYLVLFNVSQGLLLNKQEFIFDYHDDAITQFLMQYYEEAMIPKEIFVPCPIDEALATYLCQKKGSKVTISIPKQGTNKDLLDLAEKNVEISFFLEEAKLVALQDKLRLEELPLVMECFDISHLSGKHTVASMVQFRMGKPDKKNYRRFKIKTVTGIDDFSSIAEVVKRRYMRLVAEQKELPNLIIIDGGKGQLSAALESLASVGIAIPMISLAKRLEEIYFPGRSIPLQLDKKDKALQLLQAIRDEAHRFAISYNRLLRKKEIRE
jgi:excinuclease ABC subunit C